MYLKWILCDVPPKGRDAFHAAQLEWSALAELEGFLGQVGGWERDGRHRACLLSLWESAASHQHFMETSHDEVTSKSRQSGTYSGLSVRFANVTQTMEGETASALEAMSLAGVLRVAECRLRPERKEHFLAMQAGIWAEAMSASEGMLTGLLSSFETGGATEGKEDTHLLTTFWRDEASHRLHVTERLPDLQAEMRPEDDLIHLAKRWIALEESWRVVPNQD